MTGGLPWLSCRLSWRRAAQLKCLSEQLVCLVLAFFSELCYLFCSCLCVIGTRYSYFWYANIGFPVLLNVLKEDREDVELVRGALETLVGALTPIETSQGPKTEVQPASVNSDLLSRETENISLLLSLLVSTHLFHEIWMYIWSLPFRCVMCPDLSPAPFWIEVRRRLLCEILHNPAFNNPACKLAEKVPSKFLFVLLGCRDYIWIPCNFVSLYFRLQEAILLIPRGITVLMDMLMDREVSLSLGLSPLISFFSSRKYRRAALHFIKKKTG
jgi:hypothetical protein